MVMRRVGRTNCRKLGAMLVMGWLAAAVPSARSIVVTSAAVRDFLGGKSGKIVHCSEGGLYFVDFGVPNPAEVLLGSPTGLSLRPRVSLDGTRVVYVAQSKVYVQKLEPGSQAHEIADGGYEEGGATWWVHPSSRREFIVFSRVDNGLWIREVGEDGVPLGSSLKLFGEDLANAGRSADGRLLGSIGQAKNADGTYRGHGIYELKQPWDALENAEQRTHHITSDMGYCNGSMSPAGPGHPLYGCIVSLGGGHVRMEVWRYKDPAGSIGFLPTPFFATDSCKALFSGRTEFHGMGWSTHPSYIAVTTLRDRSSKGSDDVYIMNSLTYRDLAGRRLTSPELAQAAFLQITSGGGQTPHLWVEGSEEVLRSRASPGAPARHSSREPIRRVAGGQAIAVDLDGDWEVTIADATGRILAKKHGRGVARELLPVGSLPGVLLARVRSDRYACSQTLLLQR